jgi:hypothetical protein
MSLILREQHSSMCMENKYENAHTYFNFTELKDKGSSDHSINIHAAMYTGHRLQVYRNLRG